MMLNIFRGKQLSPEYKLKPPPNGELQSITATKEVGLLLGAIPEEREVTEACRH